MKNRSCSDFFTTSEAMAQELPDLQVVKVEIVLFGAQRHRPQKNSVRLSGLF